MLHPDTELRFVSPEIGHGVFATRPIPKGTVVWVRDPFDQTFSPERVARMTPRERGILARWAYVDGRGDTILCWDHARFFNHSCDAACLAPGWDFEIAVRDVPAGGELTDDYGTLGLEEPFHCLCGSPRCRGTLLPDDMLRLAGAWDARVASAFPLLRSVEQPLWDLIADRAAVESALAGRIPLPSISVHGSPSMKSLSRA